MFEWSEEEGRLMAMHHPFTHPKDEDIPMLDTDPAAVRADAYDMVINGVEVGAARSAYTTANCRPKCSRYSASRLKRRRSSSAS